MDRLILTKILSLSTRHLVILAALVERNSDNATGDTYNTLDWFGHLGSVAQQLENTSTQFADITPRDLYEELVHVLREMRSSIYCATDLWNIQYAVKPEVYALKDIIIAAARTRLRQESQEWLEFKADIDARRNHANPLTRSSL